MALVTFVANLVTTSDFECQESCQRPATGEIPSTWPGSEAAEPTSDLFDVATLVDGRKPTRTVHVPHWFGFRVVGFLDVFGDCNLMWYIDVTTMAIATINAFGSSHHQTLLCLMS